MLLTVTTTIRWDGILIEFAIIFAIVLLVALINVLKLKRCFKAYDSRDWVYIIKQKSSLKFISKSQKHYDDCMYLLAVANFELYNDNEFAVYIQKLKSNKFLGMQLYYKICCLIVNDINTAELSRLMQELSLLDDEVSKKGYKLCQLLFKVRFEEYVCSQEELEMLRQIQSDRIKKAFSL